MLILGETGLPSHPFCLKSTVYSRRFAKLIEHGHKGLTEQEKSGILDLLNSDIVRRKRLCAEGQSIRAKTGYFDKPGIASEDLIFPLSMRINATILFIGQFSMEQALGSVLETADTFGVDTNFSAVGYACDKILSSLKSDNLSGQRRRIIDEYRTWRSTEKPEILEYKTLELPSYQSPRRPFERATSLGADLDFSKGKVKIEMPPQYQYFTLRDDKGYYDPTGSTEILKKVIKFAQDYYKAKP